MFLKNTIKICEHLIMLFIVLISCNPMNIYTKTTSVSLHICMGPTRTFSGELPTKEIDIKKIEKHSYSEDGKYYIYADTFSLDINYLGTVLYAEWIKDGKPYKWKKTIGYPTKIIDKIEGRDKKIYLEIKKI